MKAKKKRKGKKQPQREDIKEQGEANERKYPHNFLLYASLATTLLVLGAVILDTRRMMSSVRIKYGKRFAGDENLGLYYAAKGVHLFPKVFKGKFRSTHYYFKNLNVDDLAAEFWT